MEYFDVQEFLRRLHSNVQEKFEIKQRSKDGEPVKLKITGSPTNFAFLTLLGIEGEVHISLDFSSFTTHDFRTELTKIVHSSQIGEAEQN